jgi:hypothetical protein
MLFNDQLLPIAKSQFHLMSEYIALPMKTTIHMKNRMYHGLNEAIHAHQTSRTSGYIFQSYCFKLIGASFAMLMSQG